jgi:UDP-N-acetylmuramate-alanine ligase
MLWRVCRAPEDVDNCFSQFLGRMRCGGVLVANGDDEGCRRVVKQAAATDRIVTWREFVGMGSYEQATAKLVLFYGFNSDNDVTLHSTDASWDDQSNVCGMNGASWHSVTHMMWAMPEIRCALLCCP